MKQIYYVIQTLLRGRGSNIIKVLSLGLALTMSILLFVVLFSSKVMILATVIRTAAISSSLSSLSTVNRGNRVN